MADTNHPIPTNVGQQTENQDPITAVTKERGAYNDAADKLPMDSLFNADVMPKGADPTPFTVGPMSPGR